MNTVDNTRLATSALLVTCERLIKEGQLNERDNFDLRKAANSVRVAFEWRDWREELDAKLAAIAREMDRPTLHLVVTDNRFSRGG